MDAVDSICADLDITVVVTHVTRRANQTKAIQTLKRLLAERGGGHLILTLRTIVESEGNGMALTAPIILAISDLILAHPAWVDKGLAWIEAFDGIDLAGMAAVAKLNRAACAPRAAIATLVYEKLAPAFTEPKKVRPPKKVYEYKRGPRKPKFEMAEAA